MLQCNRLYTHIMPKVVILAKFLINKTMKTLREMMDLVESNQANPRGMTPDEQQRFDRQVAASKQQFDRQVAASQAQLKHQIANPAPAMNPVQAVNTQMAKKFGFGSVREWYNDIMTRTMSRDPKVAQQAEKELAMYKQNIVREESDGAVTEAAPLNPASTQKLQSPRADVLRGQGYTDTDILHMIDQEERNKTVMANQAAQQAKQTAQKEKEAVRKQQMDMLKAKQQHEKDLQQAEIKAKQQAQQQAAAQKAAQEFDDSFAAGLNMGFGMPMGGMGGAAGGAAKAAAGAAGAFRPPPAPMGQMPAKYMGPVVTAFPRLREDAEPKDEVNRIKDLINYK